MGKGRLALTDGDIKVFRWLWMLRVMTLEQIRRVRYYQPETGRLSSPDNVRKRLARLSSAGYLVGDRLLETNERVYALGHEALAPLREYTGIEQQRLYRPRGSDSMTQLLHPLLVSECAVRVTEALRGSDIELLEIAPLYVPFYHTHAVEHPSARKHVDRFVTQEDVRVSGRPERHRIRPDLVFALGWQGGTSRLFFVEADRGTESPKEIVRKQIAYAAYAQAQDSRKPSRFLWQRYGLLTDFRVLLLTTDERRVRRLKGYLQSQPGFELMALSSVAAVKGKNFVFDGVWSTGHGDGRALAVRSGDTLD